MQSAGIDSVHSDVYKRQLIIHLIQCVSQIHACQHILRPVQTFQCCHHRHIGIIAQRGNRRNLVCAAVQRNALRVLPQVGLKAADEGFRLRGRAYFEGGGEYNALCRDVYKRQGKSTVSAKLSELLAMEIMEMDAHIQEKEGMSIKEIFAVNGEEYFRNCESNTLIELREKKHMVVSCGGGVPLREKNVELMKNSGYVVWLTATPEAIYDRVKDSTERPLLNGNMNVPFIQNLMESRREKYERAADIVIDTTGKEIEEINDDIRRSFVFFSAAFHQDVYKRQDISCCSMQQ